MGSHLFGVSVKRQKNESSLVTHFLQAERESIKRFLGLRV